MSPSRPARRGLAVLAAVLLACCAPAGDGSFFAGIDDLPLMPGLSENPAERSSFDSASGRIELRGAAGPATAEAILGFYADTLPQLGWQRLADDIFARGGERLRLDLSPAPEDRRHILLRIVITPG
jgi:hypothetical protein